MNKPITPLVLPLLKSMSQIEGMDNRALLSMQAGAVRTALRVTHPSDAQLLNVAADTLPKDARIYTMYQNTLQSFRDNEVKELERVGKHLQWIIEDHLPGEYVRAIAAEEPMRKFALRQGAIAETLAAVLSEAQKLADDGVMAVNRSTTLTALTERPQGPLGDLFDKAISIQKSNATRHSLAA